MRIGRFNVNPIDVVLAVLLPVTGIGLFVEFSDNVSPLTIIYAARTGDAALVVDAVDEDFDFLARDERGRTVLHAAAQSGNESIVRHVLQNGGARFVKAYDNYGYTPVHLSLSVHTPYGRGGDPTIMAFMEYGVDPNIETKFAEPLVVTAIKARDEALVGYLLERGAKLDEKTVRGQPLVTTLAASSMWKVLEQLLKDGRSPNVDSGNVSPLASAVYQRNAGAVRQLIDYGAEIDAAFNAGWRLNERNLRLPHPENPGMHSVDFEMMLRPLDLALWYDQDCATALVEHGATSDVFPKLLIHALKR